MSKREGQVSVVTRNTVRDKYTRDIYGKIVEAVKHCKRCKTTKPIINFYVAPKTRPVSPNSTRHICIECWDKERKKNKLVQEGKIEYTGNTLPLEF
jgi:hypothetical protein